MREQLEPGRYRAIARDVAMGMTKTGKEQIIVLFELLDSGHQMPWYGYFTDKTKERTFEALRTCGWEGNDLSVFINGQLDGLDTNEVEVVVDDEVDNQGVPRAKIRWVNRMRGSGIPVAQPLDEAGLRSFAAKMKGEIVAHDRRQQQGTKAPFSAPKGTTVSIRRGRATAVTEEIEIDDNDAPPF